MNLLNKKWIAKGNVNISYSNNGLTVENTSDTYSLVFLPKIFKNKNNDITIKFRGISINGDAPTLKLLDRRKNIVAEFEFNTTNLINLELTKFYIAVIYIPSKSKFEINEFELIKDNGTLLETFVENLKSDILVITPGYPSLSNKYNTAFVHTKIKNYIKAGLKVDVISSNSLPGGSIYEYDGVNVLRCNYNYLREILSKKHYDKIMVHFFDYNYGNILDSIDLTNTELFFYMHGAECLYRDFNSFAGKYFSSNKEELLNDYDFWLRDYYLEKYNKFENVTWIFVSDFVKNKAEELNKIQFNNYVIIPCYIDQDEFGYVPKNKELRKKIFMLRKFSNDRCYAIDIDVRSILELSNRDFFDDLEFDIYGSGELFDQLTAPLKNFKNVHLYNKFLSHSEIKQVHDNHGIGLFASRFDTQGVSLCESISSGCVPVTSNIETIAGYIKPEYDILCNVENYVEYADIIEKLYKDENLFLKLSEKISVDIRNTFSYKNTIQKEIELLKDKSKYQLKIKNILNNPVLTIVVPSYNVEKYLYNGVCTLINQRNANKIEVIIVDDGSNDNTKIIAEKLVEKTKVGNKSVVKLISKENGGHGSAINAGIKVATGKYLKIMDGDDTLDSLKLAELIDILEKEETDIILNNYIEDFFSDNVMNHKEVYPFMIPGLQYKFEDLCYDGYGFADWGPILSCSTYKTEMLKKLDFKLLEHCFYVDMQLNTYISIGCQTIKYYPMFVYRYLLGRTGQSVSKASYMKNYMHHQRVTLELINILNEYKDSLSEVRKNYIINKLILVMIKTQYIVTIEFYNKRKPFLEFEKELKKYPEFYNNFTIATKGVRFHRYTFGLFIWCNGFLVKVKNIFTKSFVGRIIRK